MMSPKVPDTGHGASGFGIFPDGFWSCFGLNFYCDFAFFFFTVEMFISCHNRLEVCDLLFCFLL